MVRATLSLLAAAAGLLTQASAAGQLPVVSPPPGSHYDVMKHVGAAMGPRMKQWVAEYPQYHNAILPYTRTPEGAAAFAAYCKTNKALFPNTWEELRGLSAGSGMDFDEIVKIEFRVELLHHAMEAGFDAQSGIDEASQECSDALASHPGGLAEAHNEDAGQSLRDTGFIVNATFLDADGKVESGYLSFHYPTTTAGHSFGLNIHGMHQSENSVTPKAKPVPGTVGAFFLARHVLDAKNFSDAVRRARLEGLPSEFSAGASLNVGSIHEKLLGNIEVSPPHAGEKGSHINVKMVEKDDTFFHFNMFLHTPGIEQVAQASSEARIKRSLELKAEQGSKPFDQDFVSSVVSDQKNKDLPTYRDGNEKVLTAGSCLFDHSRNTISVWWNRPIVALGATTPSKPDHHFSFLTRETEPWTPVPSQDVVYA